MKVPVCACVCTCAEISCIGVYECFACMMNARYLSPILIGIGIYNELAYRVRAGQQ